LQAQFATASARSQCIADQLQIKGRSSGDQLQKTKQLAGKKNKKG
jgi:hypothetical protein